MNNYRAFLLIFCLLCVFGTKVYGQLPDSIHYKIETQAAFSTQGYLPLWIISNRYGVLDDETDALLRAGFEAPYTKGKKFDVSYGLDIVGKKNFGNSRIQQGFLKVKYGIFEVRGGRIEETTGLPPEELSSGSLAQSRNAMPIPKVAITVPEYAPVPFTKGYLEFKGYLGHGWMGKDQHVQSSFLHEKRLYLKAGGNLPVNLYGGFVHYAVWGGESPIRGPLPSGLKNYARIFTGKGASASDAGEDGKLQSEVTNALGSHLGIYDFGIEGKFLKYKLSVYHQTPWEDLMGLKLFKNRDRLLGISLKHSNDRRLVAEVVYEYLHTKHQSGPGYPDPIPGQSNYGYQYGGRDNNYNSGLYQSGWTYKNNIIGTPLFITKNRGVNYFNELQNDRWNIVSNRIVAHHIGVVGDLGKWLRYKAKATYSRNYGTYEGLLVRGGNVFAGLDPDIANDYVFHPPLDQLYCMLELNTVFPFNKNLMWQTIIGYDIGQMSKNLGVMFGFQWNGVLNFVSQ